MIIPIYQVIKSNRSIELLIQQECLYNINIAYKIYKIKKELDEIESYTFNRLNLLCPNIDITNMTEIETDLYNTILNTMIEVNIPYLTEDELLSSDEVKLSIDDINNILLLFSEKK